MNDEARRAHAWRMDSMGELTGGLAHDFNNLLAVIQGNLQALQELATVQDDPACTPLLTAALRATQRGADLTRSLLSFSRRQQLAPAAIDAGAMLEALLTMLRRSFDPRVQLALKAAPGCPPCVADPALLEATLMNIAINARDAMPNGGRLDCWVAPCDELPEAARTGMAPGDQAEAGYVAISMADNGIGMSPDVLARASEPFFTTKQPGRGTGLGLSAAQGFARQSRGALLIDSAVGSGTCVSLYLPRERRAAPRPAPPPARSLAPLRGLSVMLVDDDLEVMAVSLSFLNQLGCEVRAYGSGEHALQALQVEAPPVLLLSDVALGEGMRGSELAHRVRARWPQVAVLLMSGCLSAPDEAGVAEAAALLLPKPFGREQLAQAMLKALQTPDAPQQAPGAGLSGG